MLSHEDSGRAAAEAVREWQSRKWQYFNLWQIAVWVYIYINTSPTLMRPEIYMVREGSEKFSLHIWIYSYLAFSHAQRYRACFILLSGISCWSSPLGLLAQTFLPVAESIGREKTLSTYTRAVIWENCYLHHHDIFIYTVPVTCLIMKFHWIFRIRVVLCFLSPLCINGTVICSIANTTRYYYFKHHVKLSWNLHSSVL